MRRYSGCITCGVADENDRGKRVREHALQVIEELALLPEVERNVVNEHPLVFVCVCVFERERERERRERERACFLA